jgi:hypothetical protein
MDYAKVVPLVSFTARVMSDVLAGRTIGDDRTDEREERRDPERDERPDDERPDDERPDDERPDDEDDERD